MKLVLFIMEIIAHAPKIQCASPPSAFVSCEMKSAPVSAIMISKTSVLINELQAGAELCQAQY